MAERQSIDTARGEQLHFQAFGPPNATRSLLFIHGACSSGKEWELVVPSLQDGYHILLPDLPHHGGSSAIKPFTINSSVRLLADLIIRHAIGGQAHIIGLSLGAHVAVNLASQHPDLAHTVFVSGYETFSDVAPETLARGLWLQARIGSAIPRSWIKWAMDGADFPDIAMPSMQLCREIAAPHTSSEGENAEIKPWSARTLIVAAGKKDWLPTADRPEDARRLRDLLLDAQSGQTRAVTHPELRHPWSRQRPELFAKVVDTWIKKGRVVEGFIGL